MDSDCADLPEDYTRVILVEEDDDGDGERMTGTLTLAAARGVQEPYPEEAVPLEAALRWARSVADIVVIQAGGRQYSAGRLAEPGAPAWVDGTELRPGRFSYEPPGPAATHYWVRIVGDGSPLDPALIERLRSSPSVADFRVLDSGTVEVAAEQHSGLVDEEVLEFVDRIHDELRPPEQRDLDLVDGRWIDLAYAYDQTSWSTQLIRPATQVTAVKASEAP